MKIKLTLPETKADYIRRARFKTLTNLGETIHPDLLEPTPFGFYLLAYGEDESKPLGMAEFAYLPRIYHSFEESPYPASLGLAEIGPIESFMGTRTLYVEPEARNQVPPYYLMLSMAGCQLAHQLGARYTTGTTNVKNASLMNLYQKTGGRFLGSIKTEDSATEIAVFVLELESLIRHRAMKRLAGKVKIDPQILRTIQSRNLVTKDHENTTALV